MQTPITLPDSVDELKALLLAQLASTDTLRSERDLILSSNKALKEEQQFLLSSFTELEQERNTFRIELDTVLAERNSFKQSSDSRDQEITRLKLLIEKLQRMLFGKKSEKLMHQIDQLELELEELYIARGQSQPRVEPALESPVNVPTPKRSWPDTLPREVQLHVPAPTCCPDCGSAWQTLGEDVSEMIERVPATFKVIRHVRPKLACTRCDKVVQAPAPSRPLARGSAGPGLLAHVMVSKYLDHQPIYRQCRIHERSGVELAESTVGDWVGEVHHLLRPLIGALRQYVLSAEKLHADDTPIAVLAPGTGKTKQARLWTYVRDDRPAGQSQPPAVWFAYSANRQGIHPQTHLKDFSGILQADAYAGYDAIYATGKVTEAGCWAHARRKFHDIHITSPTPITKHVLAQIAALYHIESSIRGSPANERRRVRQELAQPILYELHEWLTSQREAISRKSITADAIGYAMNHWKALTRYLEDGRIEIDNNAAERALRGVTLGRKNYLFLGSDAGGERAASLYSLLGTARLNEINPETYLRHVLTVIADHPVNRVAELLPWNLQLDAN